MEKLQNQLNALNYKVDALHRLVEEMSHQLTTLLAGQKTHAVEKIESSTSTVAPFPENRIDSPAIAPVVMDAAISPETSSGHKDVLEDTHDLDRLFDYNTKERSLSPDLQIRRLTAQVTAAYNRIAALEEQLLARRSDRTEQKLIRTLPEESSR